jgi:predicted ATPase with chaperone activity
VHRAGLYVSDVSRALYVGGGHESVPVRVLQRPLTRLPLHSTIIQRYMAKISGPLLDRLDIHIDVPAVNYKEMRAGSEAENSGSIRARVMRAREIHCADLHQHTG